MSQDQTQPAVLKSNYWFIVHGQRLLLTEQNLLPIEPPVAVRECLSEDRYSLGDLEGREAIMCIAEQADNALNWVELRTIAETFSAELFALAGKACQWETFLNQHRFCGRCGSRMRHVQWEMAMHCDACQHRSYPRLSPCIIVAVRDEDRILLAQNKRHKAGVYSIIAGFIEAGETAEQAAHRELMEEVGIRVQNLVYQSSQAWPFPHAFMLAFTAEYESGQLKPDPQELSDAGWYRHDDELPPLPGKHTVARLLIDQLLDEIKADKKRQK
ncbi:NAD(+) diphosphatase [Corallincola platygyrae]|uniref:NAD-capped RNA hydrolase NudC n=1 Tax=Corallincola platygyrae TaxID=1193278 RepID=A0ABW4XNT1_9GAMM